MHCESLDSIGILEGTDKTSLEQDYLRHYERIFGGIRNDPVQLVEIGIADGASLRTWVRFFPKATVIGIDVRKFCRAFSGDRIIVEIGSQADPEFLAELTRKYHPTIIIDDGSHQADHALLTFERLFPILSPGGYYVIEDVYLHYGAHSQNWHRHGGLTPAEYTLFVLVSASQPISSTRTRTQ